MHTNNEVSTIQSEDNTSGMGKFQEVPGGVEGWSWGAFFFTWLWAIPNRTWVGFTPLIPFALAFAVGPLGVAGGVSAGLLILCAFLLAFAMHFMLGFYGRKWAWQNRRWKDVVHFQRVQRYWSIAALTIMGLMVLSIAGAVFTGFRSENKLASAITESRRVASHVGAYMEEHHRLPAQLEDAGVAPPYGDNIVGIDLLPHGQLRVTPRSRPNGGFILSPSFNQYGQVEWRCLAGDISTFDMPKDCRFDTATELRFP
jgi:hypothetical protein